jgi:ABC-2 type transport system ATP-binding protein
LLVELHQPPAVAALAAIPGVAHVELIADKQFRVRVAPDNDPTERIVALAAQQHWGLRQIGPAQTSLEEVFVNLTRQDDA